MREPAGNRWLYSAVNWLTIYAEVLFFAVNKLQPDPIYPCLGTRRLVTVLEREHGITVNRKKLQRVRRQMGVEAIYCKPRTSLPEKGRRIYPYLLRDREITRADEVWCADITYVPMKRGHAYLCAVMDYPSFLRLRSQASL